MEVPAAAKELLASGALVHMATIDDDGKPHVTCAWARVDDNDEIVIATLFDQRKLRNVRRDPRVTLSIEGRAANEVGMREYLVMYGRGRVTEGGAPELLQELARTYVSPDVKFPPMPDPPPGYITHIAVDRIAGMGPWAA